MMMSSRSARRAVLSAALVCAPSFSLAQTSGTWGADVGTFGGNWSNAANWLGGNVAGSGGTALFNTLPTFTTAPVTIFQDSATVDVSGLTFDTFITYVIRPTAPANTITLSGAATIDTPMPSINTLSTTTFGHQLPISIAGSAGLTKTGPGTINLQATNTYTGGTTVNGGILIVRQFGDLVLGNAACSVTLNDGTLRAQTGGWTSSRQIDLLGNGTLEAATGASVVWNGQVTGGGNLNKIGSAGLSMSASNTFTGATNLAAGTIALSGSGALANTSAVSLRNVLTLDNASTNVTNRVRDAAPVTVFGGGVTMLGSASATSSETLGDTSFARGTSTVTVTPGAGQNASVALGNVSRDTGGTSFFRGTGLGAAPGANIANITFASAPTLVGGGGAPGTTNISILPWAFGATSAASAATAATNTFVTYGANGIRPLDVATEHVSTIAAGAATDNVRITAGEAVAAPATINSLTIAAGNGVSGAGPLTITSGGLLNLQSAVVVSVPLDFGSAEAVIHAPANITISGAISGSGGLSKHDAGIATFSAANSYSGTTIIGGGTAVFVGSVPSATNSPFGNSATAVVLAPGGVGTGGNTARLVYAGAGPASFDRDLNVSGRVVLNNAAVLPGFGLSTAQTLTMTGDITLDQSPMTFIGAAGSTLVINGDISGTGPVTDQGSSTTSIITLNGNNSFTGGVEMNGGTTWQLGSDSALGNGGLIKTVQISGNPLIQAVGGARTISNPAVSFSFVTTYWTLGGNNDLTFTGSINLSGSYIHNITNSGLTTYAGVLHTGGFTKSGAGTLLLSGSNIYTGTTTISTGTLRVSNAMGLGTPQSPTLIASGAALEMTGGALTSEPVTVAGTGVGGNGALRNLSGNNSLGDATLTANATFAVDAGKLTIGNVSSVPVAGFALTKSGPGLLEARRYRPTGLTISDAVATTTDGRSNDKTSHVSGLTVNPGATLDIGENDWIVKYPIIGPTSFPALEALVAQGYNTGDWLGTGITSRFAAASPTSNPTAVGIAEAGDVFTTFPAVFSGVNVLNSSAVLVRYTYSGDANLDGSVDTVDFNLLAAGFGATGDWVDGDFNYDGTVDTLDFNVLVSNFSLVMPAEANTPVGALVPEPTFLGSILLIKVLPRRRSRARRACS